jgi:phage FluMu gp28-like protein
MLAAKRGGAMLLSSPNGRNEFWQWYQRGLASDNADWQSFHAPSSDSPILSGDELEDIRRNTPERVFRQEYMAEFLEDGGAVFRNLRACIKPTYPAIGPFVMGVDWGRMDDYTAIVVIDTAHNQVMEVDMFNQIDWALQRGRIEALYRRWRPQVILAERNSIGDPNIEALQQAGLPVQSFTTTAASKQQVINALALAFEQSAIIIPDHADLLQQLQAYSAERLSGGTFRYSAPAGLHDDLVIALALAWRAATQGRATTIQIPDLYGGF